jgi:iron(III) transport system substrate-binding protein
MLRRILNLVLTIVVLLVAADAQALSGKLVVYTSQLEKDAQQTVDTFRKNHPGVEVEWTRSGTTDIMKKLRAEFTAGAPKPDVLLIADMVTMEALKREGKLMAHPDAPVKPYNPGIYDKDMHYFSTKLITTGIVYNTNANVKPKSIKDLLKSEVKDKMIMPSPLYSGAAAIHMHTLVQNPDFGWKFYEKLAANGTVTSKGNGGTFKAVAPGQKACGFVIDYLPIRNKLKGSPVEFVFPEEGVSAVTEPVAILSSAKNPEAAKAFVDFLLSKEGQELASSQGFLPAHPDVEPPKGFPTLKQIKLMPLDTEKALQNDKEYKKKFAELFGG